MNYKDIIQDLAKEVGRFDCKVSYPTGRKILQINRWSGDRDSSSGKFRRQDDWTEVGEIYQAHSKAPAKLVNVRRSAPPYIKRLEGDISDNMEILKNKVRREAFRHNAPAVFKKHLEAEMQQLEEAD